MDICSVCKNNQKDDNYVSFVHKWHLYNGYSKSAYPRHFCSKECLNIFEKQYRCNHCNIIIYDWVEYKKAEDGFTYCNDQDEITVGNKPCYYLVFKK